MKNCQLAFNQNGGHSEILSFHLETGFENSSFDIVIQTKVKVENKTQTSKPNLERES